MCSLFFCLSSFFLFILFFFLFFLEFINGVCRLKLMCCGGIVAYYVKCTNVVKKWYGSDCDNRGHQGCRGLIASCLFWSGKKYVLAEVSSPLIDTDTCCPTPHPVSPERELSVWPSFPMAPERVLVYILRVWVLCVCRAAHLNRGWGCNSLTQRGLRRFVRTVVRPEGTRCPEGKYARMKYAEVRQSMVHVD